jgi:hypothetical protein
MRQLNIKFKKAFFLFLEIFQSSNTKYGSENRAVFGLADFKETALTSVIGIQDSPLNLSRVNTL